MNVTNEIKIAALRSEITIGIKDLDRDNFQIYNDSKQLADEICGIGRIRLNALRLKAAAKVQRK